MYGGNHVFMKLKGGGGRRVVICVLSGAIFKIYIYI